LLASASPLRAGTEAESVDPGRRRHREGGRTGRLKFVAVRHRIEQNGEPAVEERQDLVYRDVVSGE
jgi:3-methylfumaryl-CoA hydratase